MKAPASAENELKTKKVPAGTKKPKTTKVGQELIAALNEVLDLVRSGEPPEKTCVVRTAMVDIKPGVYRKEDVKRVRDLLNVSQAVFAQVLGVEVNTVSSWEQGVREPSPMACRFMDEIAHDPPRWRKRLIDAATWKASKPEGKRQA